MAKHKRKTALERQKEIYLEGFSGRLPRVPTNSAELEAAAKERAPEKGFAYIAGGASKQDTIDNNRKALDAWKIVPRMFRDVSERNMEIELFGKKQATPILAAPIGALDIVHPDADLAVARACGQLDIPMIISNQASFPMETCAAAMPNTSKWFQLYWSKSDALVESFLNRAQQCGCEAIVVTLDTTMLGWRPKDLDLGFLPFSYAKGIGQYVSDPVFQDLVRQRRAKGPEEVEGKTSLARILHFIQLVRNYKGEGRFWQLFRSKLPLSAVRTFTDIYSRPSITWSDLAWLRQKTDLPILLKGILHPEDAQLAIDHGAQGLIVSNHGGRQVGGAIGSMEALPDIVDQVQGQIPVLVDSGIRDGADIFKALALGADAVCVGRPYAYGLALAGQRGVEEVLNNLVAEFELTMGLSGCKSIGEINRTCLKRSAE